ncbi:AraC family transcriptional regulator [Mucilaginibacter sp. UR6-11]|uniref:helix-turn-helix domain-containing protein n=1 Tax=Mucilaginibacter sp. UR6-11 TaxID=1435644 RepID=UPI001E2A0886|nr:AraC family transcriptional regulator [Mucilaginibacter sp. UR6-11]MCC8426432.1 AraC family transcriptional regulator [Mucilaginibacter sp. UR6-11]
MVVKFELEKLDLHCISIELGRAEIEETLSADQISKLKAALLKAGLELTDDRKTILIEKIKTVILEMINNFDEPLKTNFSNYLSKKLNLDYTYLANVFSDTQGSTIENFVIINKIRRVKELICNQELTLTQISWKLHYSSVAHLSTQFKKVTGVTPSHFKYTECNSLQLS